MLPTWSKAALLCWCCASACDEAPSQGGALYPPLTVSAIEPAVIVPGTALRITAEGLVPAAVARYHVTFNGRLSSVAFNADAEASVTADGLHVVVPEAVSAAAQAGDTTFEGTVTVTRDMDDPAGDASAERVVALQVRSRLVPFLTALEASELYPGDEVVLRGGDMLLGAEGLAAVTLDGVFREDDPGGGELHTIAGLVVPLDHGDGVDRTRATFTLTPDIFGVRPGAFTGTVRLVDQHRDGAETTSAELSVGPLYLRAPRLVSFHPDAASRGQQVVIEGRGLLPSDGLLQTATVLLLEGVFAPRRALPQLFEGATAIAIYPDEIEGNTRATAVLRVTYDADGRPRGLGANAGTFEGRLTPLVLAGPDGIEGQALPVTFQVKSQKQVVHIRFLPGFSTALARFGLLAERAAIEARMLEVVRRDYSGINIVFVTDEPTDFAEFSVVEVGGEDPNGTGLFGLDNTEGKDVGNRRFDDVIGGFNADTRAGNFAAYGGIFVAEFVNLSPTLGRSVLASPRFDDIFREVVPELGGKPARVGESMIFDSRGAAIVKAVRVLGNLIGSTITHEVGHSLGLTAIDGRYHNEGDTPNAIMDDGKFRPFEERAEIDGFGPATFEPFNRDYLESILPLDTPDGPPP